MPLLTLSFDIQDLMVMIGRIVWNPSATWAGNELSRNLHLLSPTCDIYRSTGLNLLRQCSGNVHLRILFHRALFGWKLCLARKGSERSSRVSGSARMLDLIGAAEKEDYKQSSEKPVSIQYG
jgi:hypothetical protein